MHLQWIDITVPPLEDIYFDFDEQVNLFIGPNASGKSTILKGIQHVKSNWNEFDDGNAYPLYRCSGVHIGVNYEYLSDTAHYPQGADCPGSGASIWDAVPFLFIPATRVSLRSQDIFTNAIARPEPYGANLTWSDILNQNFCNSWGSFNGEYVENIIDHFRRQLRNDRNRESQLRKVIESGYTCTETICNEIIRDVVPQTYIEFVDEDYVEKEDPEFYPTGRVAHHAMGIVTTDDSLDEPLYAGALSSGTQGTLLWIWALALKMANHYGWQEGWEQKPAILLIDEIENHLHPTWQRRVIPALLDHFSGLQIFATTHSPFVIAGREAGQIHQLIRDTNGSVASKTRTENTIGWTADEISREMLDIKDPTDLATAKAADELRQLRNEGPRNTLEAEEQRQQRILELRQRVDRDLLAGGPWKAQREAFKRRFAEDLERYRHSQELNQENG